MCIVLSVEVLLYSEENVYDFSVHCYTQAEYENVLSPPQHPYPLGRGCYGSDTTAAEDIPGV